MTIKDELLLWITDPELYKERLKKEYTKFYYYYNKNFRIKRLIYTTNIDQVLYIVSFVKGLPQNLQSSYEKSYRQDITLQKKFQELLHDQLTSLFLRLQTIAKKYKAVCQNNSQFVRKFAMYFQSLEDKLLVYTKKQQKQQLLNKIKEEVQRKVLEKEAMPQTTKDLINIATIIENNFKANKKNFCKVYSLYRDSLKLECQGLGKGLCKAKDKKDIKDKKKKL